MLTYYQVVLITGTSAREPAFILTYYYINNLTLYYIGLLQSNITYYNLNFSKHVQI